MKISNLSRVGSLALAVILMTQPFGMGAFAADKVASTEKLIPQAVPGADEKAKMVVADKNAKTTLILVQQQPPNATPKATPVSTPSPAPTPTPRPTATPGFTNTPTPSPSGAPPAAVTPKIEPVVKKTTDKTMSSSTITFTENVICPTCPEGSTTPLEVTLDRQYLIDTYDYNPSDGTISTKNRKSHVVSGVRYVPVFVIDKDGTFQMIVLGPEKKPEKKD